MPLKAKNTQHEGNQIYEPTSNKIKNDGINIQSFIFLFGEMGQWKGYFDQHKNTHIGKNCAHNATK